MRFIIITKKQITAVTAVMLAVIAAIVGSVSIFADNERKLPIYCVETDKKQIAISFDAAWGNTKKVQNIANPHNYCVCTSSVFS